MTAVAQIKFPKKSMVIEAKIFIIALSPKYLRTIMCGTRKAKGILKTAANPLQLSSEFCSFLSKSYVPRRMDAANRPAEA